MRKWSEILKMPAQHAGSGAHGPLEVDLPPMPSERSTGLVFATVAAAVAVLFRDNSAILAVGLGAAAAFTIAALALPHWLAPLNRAWFALALILNRVVSPIVMFVLFAGLIVPAGLVMQMRRDPMRSRRDPEAESYWISRHPDAARGSMRDQF